LLIAVFCLISRARIATIGLRRDCELPCPRSGATWLRACRPCCKRSFAINCENLLLLLLLEVVKIIKDIVAIFWIILFLSLLDERGVATISDNIDWL